VERPVAERRTTQSAARERTGSRLSSTLRHPLVVGALLALLSGVFASVLLPGLTRSWQDRPRELELKRELVERISKGEANAVTNAASFGFRRETSHVSRRERTAFLTNALNRWGVASAVIASELTTYFGATSIPDRWTGYDFAVTQYLRYTARAEKLPPSSFIEFLRRHFSTVRFGTPLDEVERRYWVAGHSLKQPRLTVGRWLGLERDQIEAEILVSDAKGFSHGFWFLGFA
jgi:hypothetical protein